MAVSASGIYDILEHGISLHGLGVVLTIMDGLQRAHVVRTEATGHGLFLKLVCTKRTTISEKSRSKRQAISLVELLRPNRDFQACRTTPPPAPSCAPPSVPTYEF